MKDSHTPRASTFGRSPSSWRLCRLCSDLTLSPCGSTHHGECCPAFLALLVSRCSVKSGDDVARVLHCPPPPKPKRVLVKGAVIPTATPA